MTSDVAQRHVVLDVVNVVVHARYLVGPALVLATVFGSTPASAQRTGGASIPARIGVGGNVGELSEHARHIWESLCG